MPKAAAATAAPVKRIARGSNGITVQGETARSVVRIADVRVLSRALAEFYRSGKTAALDVYSHTCLRRVWKAQRFSWWMTTLLHQPFDANAFDRRRQLAELDYLTGSHHAQRALAENYTGLPFD